MPLMRYLQLDQQTFNPIKTTDRGSLKAAIMVVCFIISFEILTIFNLQDNSWIRLLGLVVELSLVIYSANVFGLRPGLVAASLSTLYVAYRYAAHGGLLQGNEASWRVVIVFGLTHFALSIIVGRLRDKLEKAWSYERVFRNEAEDRQRQLEIILQQLPVGVLIVDMADHHISYSNHQAEELLGIELPKDTDLNHAFQVEQLRGEVMPSDWPLDRTLNRLETVSDEEIHYQKANGQTAHLKINAAPVYNYNDQPIAAIATIMDVSLAKELEQRKDEFISIASHELKTPVTSLKIYLQLLEKQSKTLDEAGRQELINKANRQVTRLASLMAELLDLSRLQSNKIEYSYKQQSVDQLVKEAIEIIQPSTSHPITLTGKTKLPLTIDGPKIQQVVTNIVANAVKYSPSNTPISVKLSQDQEETVIKVADKGVGISLPDQAKIFDLFFQADSTNKKTYPGLGIGLYLSKQIIQQHAGRIEVESTVGKGSIFSIILPNHFSQSAD